MVERPNIILLLNDHQAYYAHGEMSGGPKIFRPNFDKLASQGINFTRAYTASPLCAPVRRTMLTGLYPHNHGELHNFSFFPFDRETYLERLHEVGYKNYYYGKWHAGPGTAHDHHCEGFNYPDYGNPYVTPEYESYLNELNLSPFQVKITRAFLDPNSALAREEGIIEGKKHSPKYYFLSENALGEMTTPNETHEAFFLAHLACNKLEELVKSDNNQPFHLRVDFWGPHQPYYVSKEFLDMYNPEDIPEYPSFQDDLSTKPKIYKRDYNYPLVSKGKLIHPNPLPWSEWQKVLAHVYAHITMVDYAGGLILDKLDELGLSENTLVIWLTDHGDAIACHGGHFDKDAYLPEEMLRIPMTIRYPDKIQPGIECNKLVNIIDLAPTLLEVAGTSFRDPVDGKSLLPLCLNPDTQWDKELYIEGHGHFHKHIARVIITDKYKYVFNHRDIDELYDLKEDPFELHNLISDDSFSDVLEDLRTRLIYWRKKTKDRMTRGMLLTGNIRGL